MTSCDSLVLRDSDGVVGIIVVAADLLHLQMAEDATEDDVEELDTVSILHHAHIGDGEGGLGPIGGAGHHDRNSLRGGKGSGEVSGRGGELTESVIW